MPAVAAVAHDAFAGGEIWRQFPALAEETNDRRVYLDSAATTLKPRSVIDAVARVYLEGAGAVHRGAHAPSARVTSDYEEARARVRRFLRARRDDEIVFLRGTTEALNLVAECWARPRLAPGDRVIATALDHHANLLPWQRVCAQTGADLVLAPFAPNGELRANDVTRLLDRRVRLVALPHVSNVLGAVSPVRAIADAAHEAGAVVVVDGAQAAAHLACDAGSLGCDFYALSSHKMYGPSGVGALLGKREHLDAMPAYQLGGHVAESVSLRAMHLRPPPDRFEAGTPNVEGAIGWAAAIAFLDAVGDARRTRLERELLRRAESGLRAIRGVTVLGAPSHRVGLLSFAVEGVHPHDVAGWLDDRGIAVRAGLMCAEPLVRALGYGGVVRASFGVYNTPDDVDRFLTATEDVARALSRPEGDER